MCVCVMRGVAGGNGRVPTCFLTPQGLESINMLLYRSLSLHLMGNSPAILQSNVSLPLSLLIALLIS